MKTAYEKPTLVRREKLGLIAAIANGGGVTNFSGNVTPEV